MWNRGRLTLARPALMAILACAGVPGARGEEAPYRLRISNHYSPLNHKRPVRPETRYIILHTTEGGEQGSLRKVRRYGETHYLVTLSGHVYRIIDRRRIATHAGRSMWNGLSTLDNYSLGIEVVGYYDRDITSAQFEALRELLRQLQGLYGVDDDHVLTHSMVAYGRPNRFHSSNHRGRKRCGTIFADPVVRERLGLKSRPAEDADVLAGRLKVADPGLQRLLYAGIPAAVAADRAADAGDGSAAADKMVISKGVNAWSIARERYDDPGTTYVLPDGRRQRGDEIREWNRIPVGTRLILSEESQEQEFEGFLEIGKDGPSARDLAGEAFADKTTIYFFPDGLIRMGAELAQSPSSTRLLNETPQGTRILVGYTYGGYVGARRSASRIAGRKWNYPSTFYRLPDGRILSGDEVDDKAIPPRTLIFYQN
ncbi:MAG: peptidoglycan recognition family protein [Acidobacteriota bacterium]